MAQRTIEHELVGVPPAPLPALNVARLFQVMEDALRRALGDAHVAGDIADPEIRVVREREEHVGVIGEEGPARRARRTERRGPLSSCDVHATDDTRHD